MKKKLFTTLMAVALLLITTSSFAATEEVPRYLTYLATVTDGGGNTLDDGPIDVIFRIYDLDNNLLYSERQTVNVIKGSVAASVGAGDALDGSGKMNGIPDSVLKPSLKPKLEAEFVGYPAYGPDILATMPFALYSQYAIGVMDGGVTSSSIAKGAITYDHLSSSAKDELIDEITGGKGKDELVFQTDMVNYYRDPVQATMIGIRPTPAFGGGQNTLQGNMDNLDAALSSVRLENNLEKQDRIAEDAKLLPKSGGTMTGNIDMGGNNITNITKLGTADVTNIEKAATAFESGGGGSPADLNMGGKSIINVDKVDGVDVSALDTKVSTHKHTGTDGSVSLRGSAIQIKSGTVNNANVDMSDPYERPIANVFPPSGFTKWNCSMVASFQDTYDGAVGGIDRMCIRTDVVVSPNSSDGFAVRCLYSGGGSGSAGDCAFIINDGGNLPCRASYLMMCAK
ncbi:MAG: hypothetical protein ABIE74_11055 [Pseudomonadota bacterium]